MGIESVTVQWLLQFPEMATMLVLETAWSMDWLICNATDIEQLRQETVHHNYTSKNKKVGHYKHNTTYISVLNLI